MAKREGVLLRDYIKHPHVVKCYDAFQTMSGVIMVLEFAEAGDLWNYVATTNSGIAESTARTITRQLMEALRYLHDDLGVVHRDIKMENVLMRRTLKDGIDVALADFGFATTWRPPDKSYEAGPSRRMMGTFPYVAPECIDPDQHLYPHGLPATDMWSVGCVVISMLTSRMPFGDGDDRDMKKNMFAGLYTPLGDDASADAKDFVARLMRLDPKRRLTAAEALQHPWLQKK